MPIGVTATIGTGIDLLASGVTSGNKYYVAVTGAAAGGATANGHLIFNDLELVTLRCFEVD